MIGFLVAVSGSPAVVAPPLRDIKRGGAAPPSPPAQLPASLQKPPSPARCLAPRALRRGGDLSRQNACRVWLRIPRRSAGLSRLPSTALRAASPVWYAPPGNSKCFPVPNPRPAVIPVAVQAPITTGAWHQFLLNAPTPKSFIRVSHHIHRGVEVPRSLIFSICRLFSSGKRWCYRRFCG